MKTFRRFAFLFLALTVLTQTVPVSADSRSFGNTHWYVSGLSCGRPYLLDEETRSVLPLIGTCIQMVPCSSQLENDSLFAIYIGLDLYGDGTFVLTSLTSQLGVVAWDRYGSISGFWSRGDDSVLLTDGYETIRLRLSGGRLYMSVDEIDYIFEMA